MFCQVRARPLRARWNVLRRPSDWPSSSTSPESGFTMPQTRLNREVLPAPLGPIRPSTRPACRVRLMSSATRMPPKLLFRFSNSSTADMSVFPVFHTRNCRPSRWPGR